MIRLTLDNGDRWTFPLHRFLDVFDRNKGDRTTLVHVVDPIHGFLRPANVLETPDEIRAIVQAERRANPKAPRANQLDRKKRIAKLATSHQEEE